MNVTLSGGPQAGYGGAGASTPAVQAPAGLAQAVDRLRESSLIPPDRELSISIDPKTKIAVVRVLDSNTHEVLDQLPTEYVLRVTAFLESQAARESLSKIASLGR